MSYYKKRKEEARQWAIEQIDEKTFYAWFIERR